MADTKYITLRDAVSLLNGHSKKFIFEKEPNPYYGYHVFSHRVYFSDGKDKEKCYYFDVLVGPDDKLGINSKLVLIIGSDNKVYKIPYWNKAIGPVGETRFGQELYSVMLKEDCYPSDDYNPNIPVSSIEMSDIPENNKYSHFPEETYNRLFEHNFRNYAKEKLDTIDNSLGDIDRKFDTYDQELDDFKKQVNDKLKHGNIGYFIAFFSWLAILSALVGYLFIRCL